MPSYKHNTPKDAPKNEFLKGQYPWEVAKFQTQLCPFGKEEKGSDMVIFTLQFYRDASYSEPIAKWDEKIVLHPKWEWKLHQFNEAANIQVNGRLIRPGDEFDYNEASTMGLRGWAECLPEPDKDKKTDANGNLKYYNRVLHYITNKPKLAKHVDLPSAEEMGGEDPFKE